ncbi:MAG TPA: TipAS antibiotic-recognition domain-containing protein, partial [Parachlamydiaceae bacterium]|nr:TipAS antibiotic-recognition domain-containing protein [Parachlamydiaceae bacterium]
ISVLRRGTTLDHAANSIFRELGLELKQIQKLLARGDFDKIVALSSHRQVLMKNLERTRKLIKTIDTTIEHLRGTKKMKESEIYYGFSKEKQAENEKQLIDRFGEKVKATIAESHQNVRNWTKPDWDKSRKEFDEICKELTKSIGKNAKTNSQEVQNIVRRHYQWLKKFWTPTKESYTGHGQFIVDSELRKAYEAYHPQLPKFIAEAIQIFAERELI